MTELLLYGITATIVVIATVTAMVSHTIRKEYRRGFTDGYYVGIEFDLRMSEKAEEYAEIIRKEASENV